MAGASCMWDTRLEIRAIMKFVLISYTDIQVRACFEGSEI